jgi:hypothetical protein
MAIELVDRKFVCRNPKCKKAYVFTKGEQEFFLQRGLKSPSHCPDCRKIRRKVLKNNRKTLIQELKAAETVGVTESVKEAAAPPMEKVAGGEGVKVGLVPAMEVKK